jgi:hypothetical protein
MLSAFLFRDSMLFLSLWVDLRLPQTTLPGGGKKSDSPDLIGCPVRLRSSADWTISFFSLTSSALLTAASRDRTAGRGEDC